jgi:hypothetical protein
MVKLFAPAMSLDASGTVSDAMTFSKWKGRNYLRKRSVPANPQSGLQVGVRSMFSFITKNWDARSAAEKATWESLAAARTISPFNAFLAHNLQRWKRFTAPGDQYPVAEDDTPGTPSGGLPTFTGGVRSVVMATFYPVIDDNWGVMIFRGNTGFSTAMSNCVAVILADLAATTYFWTDAPLDPGTYYYNTRSFSLHGVIGAERGEESAVVTA